MTQAEYTQKFNQVQEYLLSGDCYQINLAQRFNALFEGDEWLAYKTLESANVAPFSAFVRLPEHTVLSISPERFLQCHSDKVETKPIKAPALALQTLSWMPSR
ncbi:para-aminobenzoate synthase [Vibrio ishigakensis]|uniref:Para-aminobenzoate synthase n=1 Tax=Vibrio ishigakensis TaxID=1481914 RepID=A0A0B8QEQ0_9VIBR|nr:para-aminobenzoate synthase [Vibrio ishigakensis]